MYKVSVIIPVYNAEKYLKKCIDSVLSQTLKEIEIILVNDGSTDKSGIICDEYAAKYQNIKVFHQNNMGASTARNVALNAATGEYIGFVDSDDYISNDMYKQLYDIANTKQIDIVTCNFNYVKNDLVTQGKVVLPENEVIDQEKIRTLVSTANKNHLLWFAVKSIYKSSIIKENNILYHEELTSGDETPFVLECLLCAKTMYYINVAHYFYVQSPNSITRIKYKENLLDKLQNLYSVKDKIYIKYGIDTYRDDMDRYTMEHTIPMLISNELTHKEKLFRKIKTYKKIRNSEMVKRAFSTVSIKIIESKLKYLALLLKWRMYIILALLSR